MTASQNYSSLEIEGQPQHGQHQLHLAVDYSSLEIEGQSQRTYRDCEVRHNGGAATFQFGIRGMSSLRRTDRGWLVLRDRPGCRSLQVETSSDHRLDRLLLLWHRGRLSHLDCRLRAGLWTDCELVRSPPLRDHSWRVPVSCVRV